MSSLNKKKKTQQKKLDFGTKQKKEEPKEQ
jgi:hypothetical protein